MSKNKNFFFIDDSGSRQWETPYSLDFTQNPPDRSEENLNFWRRNYFVLAGIHITSEKTSELNTLINAKKREVFGTKHVEIKSDKLRNPYQRKKFYLDAFGITEEVLKDFIDNFWYPLFIKENFIVQAFILDKRYFGGKRNTSTPLALLTQILFDRLEMFPASEYEIVFDQMENEIKSRKNDHGLILKVAEQEINASPFYTKYSHAGLRFEKSSNSNFLQIADTAAYNVYRQFIDFGHQWENPDGSEMEDYEYFRRMSECIHCDSRGVIAGFGIVKYPNPVKKRWAMTPEGKN